MGRPFVSYRCLPPDMDDAGESMKLSIARHRLAGWSEVSQQDVLDMLDHLRALALLPCNQPQKSFEDHCREQGIVPVFVKRAE